MANINDKILIMGGTHQREVGFSHPVADLLLDYYGHRKNPPDETVVGEDKATKAYIWNIDQIVVAKLYGFGNGIPSLKWFLNQPLERLLYLVKRKIKLRKQDKPPRVAETFGGECQWTSVHDPIISKYKPLFFIDLHSYHISTEGQSGKGMQINSYAETQFDEIVKKALKNAQQENPKIYGTPTSITKPINIEKLFDIGWFFVKWGKPEPRGNYFCFEAKHWEASQQQATAKFIIEYLIPEVTLSRKQITN
jgi:hypothetical protein